MDAMRKLPIGIQTFDKLREGDFLYVDKTEYIYQLVATSTPYFLSRPRRFGKSLFISTLEAYFQGRKDLFEGLAIEKLEKDWIEYPVLHLDLNAEKYDAPERLHSMLNRYLSIWEETWGKNPAEITSADRFFGIIRRAYEQTGRQVVVLIDEYDKPLLQALLDEPLLEEYRRILKAFYGVLKSADRYLRFVFLTGVTKFAQDYTSVFCSSMNQLQDISARFDYSAVCGITKDELQQTFVPELNALAQRKKMTFREVLDEVVLQCGGFHFYPHSQEVLNPSKVFTILSAGKCESDKSQVEELICLSQFLNHSNYDFYRLNEDIEVASSAFLECTVGVDNPLPMLYRHGYLTIKDYDKELKLYTLGFPNDEVRYGFRNLLLPNYSKETRNISRYCMG